VLRSLACAGFDEAGGFLESYPDQCLSFPAKYSSCQAFAPPDGSAPEACYRCLYTPEDPKAESGRSYGVVYGASIPIIDYSGCILAVDPSEAAASCAHSLNLAGACADYACRIMCHVVDDPSYFAFTRCFDEALSGPCMSTRFPLDSASTP
jgi:hypothetical protein